MNVLTVVSHPRMDSLTFAVADRFVEGLHEAGHRTEVLNLYQEKFDPVLYEEDEPEWDRPEKAYSHEVQNRIAQLERNDALAFIFPLWWWSVPAMMKGYIDRVWNYGFAYGPGKLTHRKVLWLGLVGAPEERFRRYKYDDMLNHYFNVGIASYTGIRQSQVEFLFNTVRGEREFLEANVLEHAHELGASY